MNYVMNFLRDEDGAALTEYIVLLGLLVAGTIIAVLAFGTALSAIYQGWAEWATAMPSGGAT